MTKEKLLTIFKKNKIKIVIIFTIFLYFLVLGYCYRSFHSSNKDEEIEICGFRYEIKGVPKIARQYFLMFAQGLKDHEEKVFKKRKLKRQDVEKNIKILKDQGIWDGLTFELKEEGFAEHYRSLQESQKAFQLQFEEFLEKVKEAKNLNLESLENLLQENILALNTEYSINSHNLVCFAKIVQEEVGISVAICLIASLIFTLLQRSDTRKHLSVLLFFIIYIPAQFIIFPLLNCLLSLKMSYFKEIYKHYSCNKFKNFSLFIVPIISLVLILITNFIIKPKKVELGEKDKEKIQKIKENQRKSENFRLEKMLKLNEDNEKN